MTSQQQEINKIPVFSQGAVLIDRFCLLFVTFSLHLIVYCNIVFYAYRFRIICKQEAKTFQSVFNQDLHEKLYFPTYNSSTSTEYFDSF